MLKEEIPTDAVLILECVDLRFDLEDWCRCYLLKPLRYADAQLLSINVAAEGSEPYPC